MRILIDISHPAHVHFFRNAVKIWMERGHRVHLVSRRKDIALELLAAHGLSNTCVSAAGKGKLSLLRELFIHDIGLLREARRFKPDVMLQISGFFISHVGLLTGVPALAFQDTEVARLTNALALPVSKAVLTPSCYDGWAPASKHYMYNGYHELAYLHPNRFTPDPRVLERLGVEVGEPFSLVRFVSWGAAHDVGETGFKYSVKAAMVEELARHGKVFISSEGKLPLALERYRYSIPLELIHHAMAYAKLCIGESATMASEAAILGVPAIFVSTSGRGYTTEQEKVYDMVYSFSHLEQERALEKMRELLAMENSREIWMNKRRKLLGDKIDVTDWLVRLIEGYPDSLDELCFRPPRAAGRSKPPTAGSKG
jgi:hypothetical protein